jgi:hypothetical protein
MYITAHNTDHKSHVYVYITMRIHNYMYVYYAGVDVVQVVKPCPWTEASSMTLTASFCIETKLTVSSMSAMKRDDSSSNGHAAALRSVVKDAAALTREAKLQAIDSVLNAAPVKLSNQQIVIIKDTWNKMLPWSDICMEYMAERFLFLYPGMSVHADTACACRHC